MNKYIYAIALVFLLSCKTKNSIVSKPNQKIQWITAYKKAVIISVLRQSGIDLKNDNSQAIYLKLLVPA